MGSCPDTDIDLYIYTVYDILAFHLSSHSGYTLLFFVSLH